MPYKADIADYNIQLDKPWNLILMMKISSKVSLACDPAGRCKAFLSFDQFEKVREPPDTFVGISFICRLWSRVTQKDRIGFPC